ncbi:hypothetical protein [Algibacter lectus]|uniref:Link domain-containing protein n=1 Tax=Algibacter lectus TaxID=221126 RepID=A0A090VIV1_9FLAO|nr:hypothetical protein [Algibacter lectus]GAL63279.1 hypothetical protein JCM19300_1301 [Algibacter lectus]
MKHFTYKVFLIFAIFVVYQPLFSQDRTIIMGTATVRTNCSDGQINGEDGGCLYEVKFYNQNSLTLDQAKAKAAEFGWSLATAEELTNAYHKLKLNQFAYGILADGKMAVPIQTDMGSFKKGTNIGVTGGNQGFFYTIKPGTPIIAAPIPPVSESNKINLSGDAGEPVAINRSPGGYYSQEFFKINGIPYEGSDVQNIINYKKNIKMALVM